MEQAKNARAMRPASHHMHGESRTESRERAQLLLSLSAEQTDPGRTQINGSPLPRRFVAAPGDLPVGSSISHSKDRFLHLKLV